MADSFKIADAYVEITADERGLDEKVSAAVEAASAGKQINVGLGIDAADLRGKVDAAVGEASGEKATVGLDVDSAGLREKVDAAVNGSGADRHITIKIDLDDHGLAERLAADAAAADAAGQTANNSGNGFLGLSGKVWAVVGAVVSLGPSLAALPAVLAGAGEAAGALGLAFAGVVGALRDHAQASTAAGQSSAQLAATTFSNAVSIRGAQQAISDAQRQAGISAQNSADQIAAAQQGVVDAMRQAMSAAQQANNQIAQAQQGVANALYAVGQAEQSYTNSLYSEQQAQQALIQARTDAANQIEDAKNAAADANLSAQQAAINLTKAQQALTAAQGSSLTTPLQLQEAQLALAQAQQGVVDANQRSKEATEKANQAQQNGVDGAPSVVAAQHAVEQAIEAVANAQHGVEQATLAQAAAQKALADADQAATDQQLASAEAVGKAEQALTVAQRNADDQKASSTQTVTRAEQALKDMQEQQSLAAQAAAASGSAAMTKFQQDMSKLTPQAQALVDQVLSMKTQFEGLSKAAQAATLPGFTLMLRDMVPLFPILDVGISGMGHTLSDTAAQFGHLFQDSGFQASLTQFLAVANAGFAQFASGLEPLFNSLITIGVKAAPILNSVSVGIHNFMVTGLPQFLSGLTVNAGGAAKGLDGVLGAVNGLLGPFGTLVGALAGAAGPALLQVSGIAVQLGTDIEKDLLPVMPQLQAGLLAAANVLQQLLPIAEPVVQMIASDLSDGLKIVNPLLNDLAGFLHDNADWLIPVAEGILGVVVAVKAWNTATSLAKTATDLWTKAMGTWNTVAKAMGVQAATAATETEALGAATTAAAAESEAASAGGIGSLMGKLGSSLPIIGGVIVAAGLLGQKLGQLAGVGDHTAISTDRLTAAMLGFATQSPQSQDVIVQLGVHLDAMGHLLNTTTDGFKGFDTSLAALVQNGHADDAAAIVAKMSGTTDQFGHKLGDVTKDLPQYQQAVDDAALHTKLAGDTAQTAAAPAGPFQGLALRLQNVAQAGSNTSDQMQKLDGQLSHLDALRNQQAALDRVATSMNDLIKGAAGGTTALQDNSTAAISNRQQLSNAAQAIRDYYDGQIAAGVGVDQANAKFNDQIAALETQASKTYGSKAAVDDFLKSIGLVPASTTTTIKVDNKNGVQTITDTQTQIDSLHGKTVSLTIDRIYANGQEVVTLGGTRVTANADGGPVGAGEVSLVGERGPEIVQFTRPGYVIPNDQIRKVGGTTAVAQAPTKPSITNNFNYYGSQAPSPETRAIMMRELALAVAA